LDYKDKIIGIMFIFGVTSTTLKILDTCLSASLLKSIKEKSDTYWKRVGPALGMFTMRH
jgi:hypothetical protein